MAAKPTTSPDLKKRADRIRKILNSRYPGATPALFYRSPFELLVATILSAQCTDQQVNRVTPVLFERFPSPESMAAAGLDAIEDLVHSTGFYKNKARNIKACSQALVERHGGQVPPDMDALVQLPGVGRKTANVVLGAAFDIPGVVVDTHVARVSDRLGLTSNTDPERIETDLMAVIPRKEWSVFSLRLIFFGREICIARKPKCPTCPVNPLCPYPDKTR
jgi:endonuclease III